jgi:lysophospholipase L1-like esterase
MISVVGALQSRKSWIILRSQLVSKNMKKILLLLVVLLPLAASAQTAPPFWSDILAFKKLDSIQAPPRQAILFVGSSSFTRWQDLPSYFPDYPVFNRGFGGSTLVDVIRYTYDVILPYRPKQVVIYCGENDLAYSDTVSAAEVIRRFQTLHAMIRQNLPAASIDYVSIKPSPVRAHMQNRAREANKGIQAFIQTQPNTHFIDIYGPMLDARGNMREELYVGDRLHMNADGYAIWKRIIQPYLVR